MLGTVTESNVSSIEKFMVHTMSMASNMQQHMEETSLPINEGQTTMSLINDLTEMHVDSDIRPEEVKFGSEDLFKTVDEAKNVLDEETPNVFEEKKKAGRGRQEISIKRGGIGMQKSIQGTRSTK